MTSGSTSSHSLQRKTSALPHIFGSWWAEFHLRKHATAPDIVGESQWFWQARVGERRERLVPQAGRQNAQGSAGLGRAIALGGSALAYASADVVAEGGASPLRNLELRGSPRYDDGVTAMSAALYSTW